MSLERIHDAPLLAGADAREPPADTVAGRDGDDAAPAAALTVIVAADGREKERLLDALAAGTTPDAFHAARGARGSGAPASHGHTSGGQPPAPPHSAADAVLAARLRLAALRAEEAQLHQDADAALPPEAERVLRLLDEAPEYRARLLQLAAARARQAAIEQTIAACLERLAAFEPDVATPRDALGVAPDTLAHWQERVLRARAATTAAARGAAEATAAARQLSTAVRDELARDVFDGAHATDVRWRRLWHLRRHLEEIWEVQSRAEAEARALAERETAMQAHTARPPWVPSVGLQQLSGIAALGAVLLTLWSGLWTGSRPSEPDVALAAALALVHGAILLRTRHAGRRASALRTVHDRQQAEIAALRRRRDRHWTRAAQLSAAIDAGAHALGLSAPVTPAAVDACEQDMAEALRLGGGETPLTTQLLALLAAEERAERAEAQHAREAAECRAVEREWEAWRDAAGLPATLDAAQLGEWLETRLRLADARAAQAAARAQLAQLEPVTAAWENAARAVLAAAGEPVAAETCGRELTAALEPLARRVHAARERERRRAELAADIREATLAAASATAGPGAAAPTATNGSGPTRQASLLEAAGAILAHATGGAYVGLRPAPSGGVLVVDDRDQGLPLTAIPDRAGRRCVQFLLRLGEGLLAAQQPLVVDDALAPLDDEEAVFVARAIGALARTRPVIYVSNAATRARALRLLPPPARVLE